MGYWFSIARQEATKATIIGTTKNYIQAVGIAYIEANKLAKDEGIENGTITPLEETEDEIGLVITVSRKKKGKEERIRILIMTDANKEG